MSETDWELFAFIAIACFVALLFLALCTSIAHWLGGAAGVVVLYGFITISLGVGYAVARWADV